MFLFRHLTIRFKIFMVPCAFIVFIIFQVYFYRHYDSSPPMFNFSDSKYKLYLNDKPYVAEPYAKLISIHGEAFHELDFDQRCKAYFESLYEDDYSWDVNDFSHLPYDGSIFEKKKQFIEDRIRNYRDKKMDKKLSNNEKDKLAKDLNLAEMFEIEYFAAVKEAKEMEQKLIDSNTHLRAFGACYLDQYGQHADTFGMEKGKQNRGFMLCSDIESRIFQWLTRMSPKYTRWDGEIINDGFPIMANYIGEDDFDQTYQAGKPKYRTKDNSRSCSLRVFRDSLNGKGIVLSAADKQADELVSLIALLRALGNKLPIQIVHSGDLSQNVMENLIFIGRNIDSLDFTKIDNFDDALRFKNLTAAFDEIEDMRIIKKNSRIVELLFPKQEIWFVDVSVAVSSKYRKGFDGYGNKLLAYFFNSFQHTVLMDTDSVPLVDIDRVILRSPFYQDKGAYFFKDRELFNKLPNQDAVFYSKLMPSLMDNAFFGVSPVTEFTLSNRFFSGKFKHYMESGLVAIDKKRHFTGVLSSVQSQLWKPVTSKVWGDKELFWLGLSMMGDEDYHINRWAAGSAGQSTPLVNSAKNSRKKGEEKQVGIEVCSTHPAHISGEDNSTLLWLNSGFSTCKITKNLESDLKSDLYKHRYKSKGDLLLKYKSYERIEAVIVPQLGEVIKSGEPQKGWTLPKVCGGYLFCAFDKVGESNTADSNGLLIELDQDTKKLYNFYGSCSQNSYQIFGNLEAKRKKDREN